MSQDPRDDPQQGAEATVSRRTHLLRAAADGVLLPEEVEELRAHLHAHPDDDAVIEFERRLAGELARALGAAPSSDNAEARVRAMMKESRRAAPRARRWRRARLLAAAAVIAGIALTAVFYDATQSSRARAAASGELVAFLAQHQIDCEVGTPMSAMELSTTSLDQVPTALRAALGDAPRVGDLSASGLIFRGAGPCKLPGEPSMHLLFQSADGSQLGKASVSVFLQHDSSLVPDREDVAYRLSNGGDGHENIRVLAWRSDGFVHFLVSRQDRALDAARAALDVPAQVITI